MTVECTLSPMCTCVLLSWKSIYHNKTCDNGWIITLNMYDGSPYYIQIAKKKWAACTISNEYFNLLYERGFIVIHLINWFKPLLMINNSA